MKENKKSIKIKFFREANIPQFEAEVLQELEKQLKKQFYLVNEVISSADAISYPEMGFSVGNNRIIGIILYKSVLSTLPESLGKLTSLQELNLWNIQLSTLPESIGKLTSLQKLYLSGNQLSAIPESISNLKSLTSLSLSRNQFSTLPESIGNLTSLQKLWLEGNQLIILPESIGKLTSLQELELGNNQFLTLTESIGNLTSLQKLWLEGNQLSILPESIGKLTSLQTLWLEGNRLTTLPESLSNLKSLTSLNLSRNQFSTLPESIGNLTSLQYLNLSGNKLTALPESFWRLKNLSRLDLENNTWKGEWKEIINKKIAEVLAFSMGIIPISIFIIYSYKDQNKYHIKKLKKCLEKNSEIRQIYHSGADEMSLYLPKSHLLLFLVTKNSINNNECQEELKIGVKEKIPIIPIKTGDVEWSDLSQIDLGFESNLSQKLGLEYDCEHLKQFCRELYHHIKKFKREINLFEKKERLFQISKTKFIEFREMFLNSELFRDRFNENLEQFKTLYEQLKNNQISSLQYLLKCAQLLNSKS